MIFTSNVAQAIGALILALVLVGFHRLYQRRFLLTWAWSWWAFCVSLLAGSIALLLTPYMPADAPLRFSASVLSTTACYWQAAWLLSGTYEVVTGRLVSRRTQALTLAVLFILALATIGGSMPMVPRSRVILRVGLKCLVLGAAFVIASWGVWRSRARPSFLGGRLVSSAFLLYGLHQFHYLVILMSPLIGVGSMNYSAYLAPFDFLFQTLVGIGMVTWLLEAERQRVVATSAQIEHLAYHDPLTDLPNRNLLLQHLQQASKGAEARRERLAVLFLDLDRFKMVNESMGNRYGDEILQAVAERLKPHLRGADLLARIAADEFAAVLPAVDGEAPAVRAAERLLEILRPPFALQGREVYLTASIGISRFPEDGADAETLLKRAEIAMYRAKETSRDGYQLYAPGMDSNTLEQLSLEADLRRALSQEQGELTLYFQPVLDSGERCIGGVEALLRWNHPVRGLMTPGEFLWLAEVSGLASVLDLWVLRTACREIQEWHGAGAPGLQLAVNLSPRTFQQPDLLKRIKSVLADAGLPPSSLVLEITETLAMQNAEATLAALRGLKELGVKIAIDDFGTGYSSLSYLTTFPIDTLKVDRSFVHTLGRGRGGEEVAAAVIALAVSLGISVIAEGVEEEEQWRWLEGLGCERFQGYLFSPPLPAPECRKLVLQGGLDDWIAQSETPLRVSVGTAL
ncbi:MAG TPA: EAL domain-containing protein [Thermoanaerobaculia bacterium]|nr:EAL domain-containing protein [Thermoanaerobaculia bacterium]